LLLGQRRAAIAFLALLGPASALYLWRASATPDQVWVMRRYLPSAVPLFVLAAFWLVAMLLRADGRGYLPWLARAVAALVAIAAITVPLATSLPLRSMSEQRNFLAAVTDTCAMTGHDSAIVVLEDPTGLVHEWIPQTLRTWCDVPVAQLPKESPDQAETLQRLADDWAAEGRELWVVAGAAQTIEDTLPGSEVVATRIARNPHFLEQTLFDRPDRYLDQAFALAMAPVESPGQDAVPGQ
jgi:hypothetical protein